MSHPSHQEWRDEALCQQTDPEIFFPERGYTPRAALKVCAVRAACLADAIEQNEPHGVRGGMTPNQRAEYVRAQQSVERSASRWG